MARLLRDGREIHSTGVKEACPNRCIELLWKPCEISEGEMVWRSQNSLHDQSLHMIHYVTAHISWGSVLHLEDFVRGESMLVTTYYFGSQYSQPAFALHYRCRFLSVAFFKKT